MTGDTYLAGLWKSKIVEGLCWAVTGRDDKSKRFNKAPRAPTWSWASMKGPTYIQTPWSGDFAPQHEIEVLDAWTRPNGTNPFGDAAVGELKVRGRIKRAQAWSVMTRGGVLQSGFGVASLFDPGIDLQNNHSAGYYMDGGVAHIYMDRLKFYTFQPWPVWVLPIVSYRPIVDGKEGGKKLCALVLTKVGDDTFAREGFLWRLSKGSNSQWDSKDEDGEVSWFGSGYEEVEIKII